MAAVQLAIATGAAAGGAVFDASGAKGVFVGSVVAPIVAVLTILSGVPAKSPAVAR